MTAIPLLLSVVLACGNKDEDDDDDGGTSDGGSTDDGGSSDGGGTSDGGSDGGGSGDGGGTTDGGGTDGGGTSDGGGGGDGGAPVDEDGDGYTSDVDCDDLHEEAHPGGTEVPCTAIDEDCDGTFDEDDDSAAGMLVDGVVYEDLQSALTAAPAGATVWICPGTYHGDRLQGTRYSNTVTIASSARDASRTILTGDNAFQIVRLYADATLQDLTFSWGRAEEDGGAVTALGSLTVERCVFDTNSASEDGGAIWWASGKGELHIRDSSFRNSYAALYGAAVAINNSASPVVTITGSTFDSNTAGSGGPAISISRAEDWSVEIEDCTFTDNVSRSIGGAITYQGAAADNRGRFVARDSLFRGNQSEASGGAIYIWSEYMEFELQSVTVVDNHSGSQPGAIYAYGNTGTVLFQDSAIEGNISDDDGAAVYTGSGDALRVQSIDSDWGEGLSDNEGADLGCRCGWYEDLVSDESFTCHEDRTWTEP